MCDSAPAQLRPWQLDMKGPSTGHAVFVKLDNKLEAKSLHYHIDFPKDSVKSESLASGARVLVAQASSCTMSVQIGSAKPLILVYPF